MKPIETCFFGWLYIALSIYSLRVILLSFYVCLHERMGVGGKAIPPYVDRISGIRSDAKFILLVEKEAAYMRLAEDRWRFLCAC
jgi:DNA topoisomerase VI subunit A